MSHDLRVERTLNTTPEQAFDVYTDTEAQKTWFALGPDGPDGTIVEITNDLRVGGEWNAAWGDTPDQLFRERGVYQVVDRPHRVVMTSTAWAPGEEPVESTIEVTFENLGDKTKMVVTQTGLPTAELRDFMATTGWNGAFDRIERYLALQQQSQ